MSNATMTEKRTGISFRAKREAILDLLSTAVCAAHPRSPKPVLACVLIETGDGKITVSATSLSSWVRASTTLVQVEGDGAIAVNADALLRRIRSLSSETIMIAAGKNDTCEIIDDSTKFSLYTANPKEFPPIQNSEQARIELSASDASRLILHTSFATADELTRYAMTGIYFDKLTAETVAMVATDGHRIAFCEGAATGKAGIGFLFPDEGVSLLKKALEFAEPDDRVEIWEKENVVGAIVGDIEIGCTKLEATFPPYKDFLPKDFNYLISAGAEDFASAFHRASLVCTEEKTGIKLSCSKKGLRITGATPEGEVDINLPCKFEGQNDIEIGVNPKLVLDGISTIPSSETLTLRMNAPNMLMMFSYNQTFKFGVMPCNLL